MLSTFILIYMRDILGIRIERRITPSKIDFLFLTWSIANLGSASR